MGTDEEGVVMYNRLGRRHLPSILPPALISPAYTLQTIIHLSHRRATVCQGNELRSGWLARCALCPPASQYLVQAAARAGEQDHELQRGNQKKTLPFTPWAPLADSTRGHAERRPPHRAPGRVLLVALDAPAPPSALLSATDYLLFHSSVRDHAPAAVPRPLPVARPTARACCAW